MCDCESCIWENVEVSLNPYDHESDNVSLYANSNKKNEIKSSRKLEFRNEELITDHNRHCIFSSVQEMQHN